MTTIRDRYMKKVAENRNKRLYELIEIVLESERTTTGPDMIDPMKLKVEYAYVEKPVKSDRITQLVQGWLLNAGWRSRQGPDPPDLYADNGRKVVGVEVVPFRWDAHSFVIGKNALKFDEGEVFWVIAVQIKPQDYETIKLSDLVPGLNGERLLFDPLAFEPLVLTRDEMLDRCKDTHEPRKDHYTFSCPRTRKGWKKGGWEEHYWAFHKLGKI